MARSSRPPHPWLATALLAGPALVLCILLDNLTEDIERVAHPGEAALFSDVLVHLAAVVACAGSAWLLLVTAVATVVSQVAPTSGWARRVAMATPRLWRDVVLTLVGVSVLSTPAVASAQPDQPSDHDRRAPSVSGLVLPDRPSTPRSKPARAGQPRTSRHRPVHVRRGDTLWSIAAARLPADATTAETARSCAAWYAVNREVIGDDPDLILPGMSLQPPLPPDEGPS